MKAEFVNILNEKFDLNINDKVVKNKGYRSKNLSDKNYLINKDGDIRNVLFFNAGELCDYIGMDKDDNHRNLVGAYLKLNGFLMKSRNVNGKTKKCFRLACVE